MAKCFKFGLDKHRDRRCIGTRELLTEEDEVQPNGKVFKKWKMGEYSWNSYVDVDILSTHFGRGLRELGQLYRQNICIFADTKAEWMVAAQVIIKTSSSSSKIILTFSRPVSSKPSLLLLCTLILVKTQ